ncbi:MAG TPA: hypothetical protein VNT75_20450 [Symbiobacteriaceae bacterium]|nr:hypothetical protein [Symbiobacteriaceae bacterium]
MYYGGYPATKASGFSKVVPTYSKAVAPGFGKLGKPIGKPFGKPIGKPFGKPIGKPFGVGKPFGGAATKSSGYNYVVPTTTVKTSPYPGAI